jgi:hypothetical protein
MALEYCDSFNTYSAAQAPRRYPGTNMTIGTPGADGTGQYIYASGDNRAFVVPLTARSEYYIGFDFQCSSFNNQRVLNIQTAAGATICNFSTGSGLFATTFGNTTGGMVANVWYQVQIYIKRNSSTGILTVKVDGVTVLNLTGLNTGSTDIGQLNFGCEGNGNGGLSKYDNLWVFNTLGSHSNGFPVGRMKVQALYPAADGTYTAWTPNSGTMHYNRVNQAQADDDTTYNAAITSGDKDSYGIGALPGSPAHIHGVVVTAIVRKDDVDSKNLQVFTKSGSTETFGSTISVPLGYLSSTTNGTAAILHGDDPNTSAEWSQTNVNALEVGVKVTL